MQDMHTNTWSHDYHTDTHIQDMHTNTWSHDYHTDKHIQDMHTNTWSHDYNTDTHILMHTLSHTMAYFDGEAMSVDTRQES